ncbi:DUF5753 domain-containing protein [Streptomyces sp. NPDC088768]|uniref:DUF5753 domain-containing protein n=1 Tax=Streptomyces sp. NPDC088768 TaxID=3365894 RepID=UPI003828EAAB
MTRKQVATSAIGKQHKINESLLGRIEGAQTRIRTKTVLFALLELYDVEAERREELIDLWTRDREGTEDWVTAIRPSMSAGMTTFVGLEGLADHMRIYAPVVVPGLFQTERYTRALFEIGQPIHDMRMSYVRDHVALRMERKRRVFERQPQPVKVHAVISEAALITTVGSEKVMEDQLANIVMLSRLPYVEVQILPLRTRGSVYRAQQDFAVLTMPDPIKSFVQSDTVWGASTTSDKPREVEHFTTAFNSMSSSALAPELTPEYLHNLIKERVTT